MLFNNIYLFLYFASFSVLFFLYQRRRHLASNMDTCSFSLGYYAITALCSILYYNASNGFYRDYSHIGIPPLIYLFFAIIVTIFPLYVFESSVRNGNAQIVINGKILNFLVKLTIICAILPFCESIIRLPQALAADNAAMQYASRLGGASNEYLSFLGRKFFTILWKLNNVIPIMLCLQLTRKFDKKLIFGLLLALITIWLHSMVLGGRSKIVQSLLYTIFVFFVFKDFLNEKIKQKIVFYGAFAIAIAVFTVGVTTVSRFGDMSNSTNMSSIWEWIGLYAGEGTLNFCETAWFLNRNIAGHTSLGLLYSIIDMHFYTVADLWDLKSGLGIPGYIFYTYVGQLLCDYGHVGAMIFLLILSFCAYVCLKVRTVKYVVKLTLICLIGKMLVVGPIFYTYGPVDDQINVFVSFVVVYLICSKRKIE